MRVRLVTAVVIVGIALFIRIALTGLIGTRLAYPVFYSAVIITGIVGGVAAGAAAVVLSVLLVTMFVLQPRDWADWLSVVVFAVGGGLTILMTAAL